MIYAKIGWTGFDGPLPKLTLAHLLPQVGSSRFADVYEDEESDKEEEEEEQQQQQQQQEQHPIAVASEEKGESDTEKLERMQREIADLLAKTKK